MNDFILYSYYRSSSAYRVRIALNLKDIKYEYRAVHLLNNGGEQKSAEYTRLNPSAEVPTLVHKNRPLSQSVAIFMYLDSIVPQPALFPQDPYERARVLQACEIINSGIQPIANLKVFQELEARCQFDQQRKSDWAAYWIQKGFQGLEEFLKPVAGTYSFAHQLSAADLFLVPQVYNAKRFNVDMSQFPVINQINSNCLQLPVFQKAAPDVQPDTP